MTDRFRGVLLAVAFVLVAAPAVAHHAVQAQFDFNKPLELTGVLSKIEWVNPHTYIYLDVKDEGGKVTTWALETAAPAALRKAGLSKAARGGLVVGETYSVKVFAGKADAPNAWLTQITLQDGRVVTLWFGDPLGR